MSTILVATGNRGKTAEIRELLGPGVDVVSLDDLGLDGAEETGVTFEENAVLKAAEAARASGLLTVADDSGIEVDALGGAPGVFSARYSGPDATDESNRLRLLADLDARGTPDRSARFVCVIAVAHPDGTVVTFHGTLEGQITSNARGTGGFGYDPILELPDGRTVAELTRDEKNRISHRGKALRKALPYIQDATGNMATSSEG